MAWAVFSFGTNKFGHLVRLGREFGARDGPGATKVGPNDGVMCNATFDKNLQHLGDDFERFFSRKFAGAFDGCLLKKPRPHRRPPKGMHTRVSHSLSLSRHRCLPFLCVCERNVEITHPPTHLYAQIGWRFVRLCVGWRERESSSCFGSIGRRRIVGVFGLVDGFLLQSRVLIYRVLRSIVPTDGWRLIDSGNVFGTLDFKNCFELEQEITYLEYILMFVPTGNVSSSHTIMSKQNCYKHLLTFSENCVHHF